MFYFPVALVNCFNHKMSPLVSNNNTKQYAIKPLMYSTLTFDILTNFIQTCIGHDLRWVI